MADKPASERNQKATPERLRKARQEGRLPVSEEVPSALTVGFLAIAMTIAGPQALEWIAGQMRRMLSMPSGESLNPEMLKNAVTVSLAGISAVMLPFLLAGSAASVLGSLAVSGWSIAPKAMRVQWERLNPVTGMQNLFSSKAVVKMLVGLAKLAVLTGLVWSYLDDRLGECLATTFVSPGGLLAAMGRLTLGVLIRLAVGLGVIAGVDAIYQIWKYRQDLRMTRQEVREEAKEQDLNPQVRSRIRAIQSQMARRRMMAAVSKADVVVVNPTHIAVAMIYDQASMESPQVVAKGSELLAARIRQVAEESGVPVVHRPELARALYRTVAVGQSVPEGLFVAVAEVLAMIYRLRRHRRRPS